jgi:nucleoside-diphosphate-sugar epimerase
MPGDRTSCIALTGATGFLGSHIADRLLADGYQVRVAVRPSSNRRWLEGKPLDVREVDLLSAEQCRAFVQDTDGLIHCAGLVSATREEDYRKANVDTTRVLLEAAREVWGSDAGRTFLLVSSLAAHGPASISRPAVETSECHPITAYGRSKLAAEQLVLDGDWGFRCVSLRPPGLYGPRDFEFVPLFKAARWGLTARIGRSLTGLSLVDGRDAAAAAVALLACDRAVGPYFVDDGQAGYSWPQLAAALGQATGRKVRVFPLPLELLRFAAAVVGRGRAARSPVLNADRLTDLEAQGWACDGARLRRDTGFQAQFDLVRGFRTTMDFLREQEAP